MENGNVSNLSNIRHFMLGNDDVLEVLTDVDPIITIIE
jgi:hypothetical protein